MKRRGSAMTVAPFPNGSMDLSSGFPDLTAVSPEILLIFVGLLVAVAVVRATLALFRLIAQLLRSLAVLIVVVGLIAGWTYQHGREAVNHIEAPASHSPAIPSAGQLRPQHK